MKTKKPTRGVNKIPSICDRLSVIPSADDRLYYFLMGHLPGKLYATSLRERNARTSRQEDWLCGGNLERLIVRQWNWLRTTKAKSKVEEYEQTVSETSDAFSEAFSRWDWKFFENISKLMRQTEKLATYHPDMRLFTYLSDARNSTVNLTQLAKKFADKSGSNFDSQYKYFKRIHKKLKPSGNPSRDK